jgi:hypothetical protein
LIDRVLFSNSVAGLAGMSVVWAQAWVGWIAQKSSKSVVTAANIKRLVIIGRQGTDRGLMRQEIEGF